MTQDTDIHFRLLTHLADTISAGAILGTFLGYLPPLAAFVATLWYCVQIWESHTVQKWVRLHLRKRKTYRHPKRRNRVVHRLVKSDGPTV
jgi:hypothetical protein